MDPLFSKQSKLGKSIETGWKEYKADKSQKGLEFLERLKRLDADWKSFDGNNTELLAIEKKHSDITYFKSTFYKEIENIC